MDKTNSIILFFYYQHNDGMPIIIGTPCIGTHITKDTKV